MPQRQHRRVKLRMPVRLRWVAPLSQEAEICETVDVSRTGLLVRSTRLHASGTVLWVTSPYDASLPGGQPEIPARVVRAHGENAAGQGTVALALHFEKFARANQNGQASAHGHPEEAKLELHAGDRRPLAIPLRVRPKSIPWFEEAMTLDVSAESLRFVTTREYSRSEPLVVSFDPASAAPWRGEKEFLARILRVEPLPDSPSLAVIVMRVHEHSGANSGS